MQVRDLDPPHDLKSVYNLTVNNLTVAQSPSRVRLCDPMNGIPPDSSVYWIF